MTASKDRVCPACGAPTLGRFCQECGQRHRDSLPSVRQFFGNLISSSLDLEGPFWNTMRALRRKPGSLTIAYREGRLSPFVSPVRLFIVASALYFLVSRLLNTRSAMFFYGADDIQAASARSAAELRTVLLLPFLAFVVALFRRRDRIPYVGHLVKTHVEALDSVIFAAQ